MSCNALMYLQPSFLLVYTLLGLLPQISLHTKLLVNWKGFIKSILIPIHFKFPLSFAVKVFPYFVSFIRCQSAKPPWIRVRTGAQLGYV